MQAFLDERFSKYLNKQRHDKEQIDIFKELYDWHIRFQVIDNSCENLSRLSAKRWGEYVCLNDATHSNFKYGYKSLVQVILNGLPQGCVKYNSEVAKISFTEDKKVQLIIKNNKIISCDHLILTPSLGVLKEFNGLSNVLSKDLIENVHKMGFAGICKIYLFYDKKWWGDSKG